MNKPSFDADGYPTDETLDKIESWSGDWEGLMNFIKEAWRYKDYFKQNNNFYTLCTGGWSGNESLMTSLKMNYVFWSLFWVSSHRGGKYKFELNR